jgi:hypothetical protein
MKGTVSVFRAGSGGECRGRIFSLHILPVFRTGYAMELFPDNMTVIILLTPVLQCIKKHDSKFNSQQFHTVLHCTAVSA